MNSKYAKILIGLVFSLTFAIDVATPLGYEVYVGHFFAVLLALWLERPTASYLVAAIATVLLVLEFELSPAGIPLDMAVFNRIVGIGLLWVTAMLVARAKIARLDDATRRLGSIVESSSDAILSLTPDGIVTSWNAGAERMFGYTAAEIIGKSVRTIVPAEFHQDVVALQSVVEGGQSVRTNDAVRLTKTGRRIEVSITLSPLWNAAGRCTGISKIVRDINDLKRAQALLKQARESLELTVQERTAELNAANHALRKLSSRLMQVQEEERSRLARDLHDEVGQLLTALKIDLQEVQHGVMNEALSRPLTDSLELVDRLLSQVRTLALDLRPSLLDDLGLVPALRWYVNRQAQRNGWRLCLSMEEGIGRLPAEIEVACFRVVQEALTNVARYAKPKVVDLILDRQDHEIILVIEDDGEGFDVMLAKQRAQGGESIGLLGMEERVRLAGGTLSISSTMGRGTSLRLCFPLTKCDQTQEHGPVEVTVP